MQNFLPFKAEYIYIYIYIYAPCLVYPFICLWPFVLHPYLSCCEQHYYKYRCTHITSRHFQFSWVYTQKWNCWTMLLFYFQFFQEPPYCFLEWLYHFTSTLFMIKCMNQFLHILARICVLFLYDSSHFNGCKVVYCSFDLHFSNE